MTDTSHTTDHPIVLAAGGTGGHVFPAEALAQELIARGHRLVLITDRRGAAYGGALGQMETVRISAGALAGRGPFSRIGAVINLTRGYLQARRALRKLQPSVVVGFGGYAAAPTMLAAVHLGLRTAVHEQNAILGRTNRLLAARVNRVCTSLDLARPVDHAAVVRTGMPVRPAIAVARSLAYLPPVANGPFRVLVLGGSQGARIFSHVMPEAVALLPQDLRQRLTITQQCRPEDIDHAMTAYAGLGVHVELRHFFSNVPELLGSAHLLITRSGASTVAEALVAGRPALLVPYPHAADDHQTANAAAVAAAGAGWLVPQPTLTAQTLAARLTQFAAEPKLLGDAAAAALAFSIPDAAARLADVIAGLIRNGNGARHGVAAAASLQSTITPGAA
jgi:UDP-N-acetylglucosamine--N-acetylmuramyl-(pentapeptide) pyrophosphoryl-undecaprenol N-acetylglucosamine transferase